MKRATNIYPVYVFGREIYVSFDHFTNGGQAVYNAEFIAVTSYPHQNYMVRYTGIKAANQEQAARAAFEKYEQEG